MSPSWNKSPCDWWQNGDVRVKRRRLTKEQEEQRLSGLRTLARLIALRCLADLQPGVDEEPAAPDSSRVSDADAAREEELA